MLGLNWVDLVLLLVFFVIISDGRKSDFVTEILKVIGIILATFITLHYYLKLSALFQGKIFVPQNYRDLFAYGFLIGLMFFMVALIRGGWLILLGVEASPVVEKWGKTVMAGVRAYLMVGLVFLAFFVSNNPVMMDQARRCGSAPIAGNISLDIYQRMFRLLSRFFPKETINVEALVLTAENRKAAKAVIVQKLLHKE